ncbi:MAG: PAS domain-containing protein [Rhodospirillaceae bacterium]
MKTHSDDIRSVNRRLSILFPALFAVTIILVSVLVWQQRTNEARFESSKELATSSTRLAWQAVYLDEALTMSTWNAVITGEYRWQVRYGDMATQLDLVLEKVKNDIPSEATSAFFEMTGEATEKLYDLEDKVFSLLNENRYLEARDLMEGDEYRTYKDIYSAGTLRLVADVELLIQRIHEEDQAAQNKFLLATIFGTVFLILCWAFVYRITKNLVGEVISLNQDLEGRVEERTKELKESQSLFKTVLDNIPAIIFLKDMEGRYRFVNSEYEKVYEVNGESMIGKTVTDIYEKELAEKLSDLDQRTIESGRRITSENDFISDKGHFVFASEMFPVLNSKGDVDGFGGVETDITDRKEAEMDTRKNLSFGVDF